MMWAAAQEPVEAEKRREDQVCEITACLRGSLTLTHQRTVAPLTVERS